MTFSLRHRMVLRLVLAVILILAVSGVTLSRIIAADMHARFDARLLDRAADLASEVEWTPAGLRFDAQDFATPIVADTFAGDVVLLAGPDGVIRGRWPADAPESAAVPVLGEGSHAFTDARAADGGRMRWVHLSFEPEAGGEQENDAGDVVAVLSVGRRTQFLDQALLRADLIMLAGGLATIAVLVVAVLGLIRATLAPVEALASGIAALDVSRRGLRSRVIADERNIPPDFRPIVDRLDELMARLDAAFTRETAFNADFSHEMRTPLAGLRTTLEVARSRPRAPAEYDEMLDECLAMVVGMQSLVETMLTLKRVESGDLGFAVQEVPLRPLVTRLVGTFAEVIRRRNLAVEVDVAADLAVDTDPDLFAVAVRNVLENAVSHGDEHGRVTVQAGSAPEGTWLEVANTGCRLTRGEAQELRARFRRGDASRTAAGGHSGLGLALVDGIATTLGFAVQLEAQPGGEYRLRLQQTARNA